MSPPGDHVRSPGRHARSQGAEQVPGTLGLPRLLPLHDAWEAAGWNVLRGLPGSHRWGYVHAPAHRSYLRLCAVLVLYRAFVVLHARQDDCRMGVSMCCSKGVKERSCTSCCCHLQASSLKGKRFRIASAATHV